MLSRLKQELSALEAKQVQLLREVSRLQRQKAGYAEVLGQLTDTNLQLQSELIQAEDSQYAQGASDISSSYSGVLEDYADSFELRPESPGEMGYEELLELGERIGSVNIGLDDAQIKAIPEVFISNLKENCAVCQSSLGRRAKRLPGCKHCFHAECIDPWLKKKRTCPVCLVEVPRRT
jgi:hypothetical protein